MADLTGMRWLSFMHNIYLFMELSIMVKTLKYPYWIRCKFSYFYISLHAQSTYGLTGKFWLSIQYIVRRQIYTKLWL